MRQRPLAPPPTRYHGKSRSPIRSARSSSGSLNITVSKPAYHRSSTASYRSSTRHRSPVRYPVKSDGTTLPRRRSHTSPKENIPVVPGEVEGRHLLPNRETTPASTSGTKPKMLLVGTRSLANLEVTRDQETEERCVSAAKSSSARHPQPRCPVSESTCERFHHKRRHVMRKHLPARFRDSRLPDSDYHQKRMSALNWIATTLLGTGSTLDDLLSSTNPATLLPATRTSALDSKWMTTMCQLENWPLPDEFRLNPIDCKAALAHWRTLAVLLTQLTPDQRTQLFRLDARVEEEAHQSNDTEEDPEDILDLEVMDVVGYDDIPSPPLSAPTPVLPVAPVSASTRSAAPPAATAVSTTASDAIDAHFHLDRLSPQDLRPWSTAPY